MQSINYKVKSNKFHIARCNFYFTSFLLFPLPLALILEQVGRVAEQ